MAAASRRAPTMRDVSRLAGVSPMTVSRTLGDPDTVSADTRSRVLQAVEQLGYVPDRGAGSLASRRTGFVAVILPTLTNANFADTARGLTDAMRSRSYQPLIGYTGYSLAEEERLLRAMLSRRPDAVVVAGTRHTRAARDLLVRAGVPVVEVWDRPDAPVDRAVGFSNYEVGRLAARHLVSLGWTRIAGLGPDRTGEARDFRGEARLRGFGDGLAEAGLATDLVLHHGPVGGSFAQGTDAMAALLGRAPDVQAVFLVSDIAAFGALMECHRRGVRVPQDVSILGFGDFDIGRQCVPPLSTIGVDAVLIGRRCGELLLRLLDGEDEPPPGPAVVDVGITLVERGTTAPAS